MSQSLPVDPTQKTLLHLHAAAQSVLPQSRALSSHLTSHLLSNADENDVNLPQTYIETRFCQKCATAYIPGITCIVRNVQSRRQKRKARNFTWIVYECNVCHGKFRTEVDVGHQPSRSSTAAAKVKLGNTVESPPPTKTASSAKKKKRERMQGLKKAIEKSKEGKANLQLSLLDLMKVD